MQPQQQTLSPDALNALYRDLGESKHAIYERNVRLNDLAKQLEAMTAERDALKAKYEPAEPEKAEPTPMKARKNGVLDQAIDAVKAAEKTGG